MIIKRDLSNLTEIKKFYINILKEAKDDLLIENKTYAKANSEHASKMYYYAEHLSELKRILKFIEIDANKTYGELFKKYTENVNIELSDKAKERYIFQEQEYIKVRERVIEIEDLIYKFELLLNAFEKRGYALNNLTKLIIEQVHNELISS